MDATAPVEQKPWFSWPTWGTPTPPPSTGTISDGVAVGARRRKHKKTRRGGKKRSTRSRTGKRSIRP